MNVVWISSGILLDVVADCINNKFGGRREGSLGVSRCYNSHSMKRTQCKLDYSQQLLDECLWTTTVPSGAAIGAFDSTCCVLHVSLAARWS